VAAAVCFFPLSQALGGDNAANGMTAEPAGFQPQLLQISLDTGSVPAGGILSVTYWWQNTGNTPCDVDERVFVHVCRAAEPGAPLQDQLWSADHDPGVPTHRWHSGPAISYSSCVPIPATAQPGNYVLLIGLYLPARGTRRELDLPLPHTGPDAPAPTDRRYQVAQFSVLPAGTEVHDGPVVKTFRPLPQSKYPLTTAAPINAIAVGTGPLSVFLDAERPRIAAWRMDQDELPGDPENEEPEVVLFKPDDPCPYPAAAHPWSVVWKPRNTETGRLYAATVNFGNTPCVQFDLAFSVTGTQAEIALDHVAEFGGYTLACVRMDRIVAARDGARMAVPLAAGQLVTAAKDTTVRSEYTLGWTNPVLAAIVHDRKLACALDDAGVDDHVIATTRDGWVALGASFEHRAATRPPVPPLLLADRCAARLQFAKPDGKEADWMDGARLLRPASPVRPPDIYKHAALYKIFCDSIGTAVPTTFADALDLVRRFANLTDGAPQVAYLVGWQHSGHDTGYPDVFSVDERLGGLDALVRAMRDAGRFNCVLSFHDNYDDAYEGNPGWNPDLVARDATGELTKGGVWGGRQSYIINPCKYAQGAGKERIRRTLDMYPIRQTYHIDVLSAVPRRCDFNPLSPASGAQCLAGKIALVREFNRRGVDVTSEGFCAPFVGIIGHSWNLIRHADTPAFPGETPIPLIPFIYSGCATWGGAQPTNEDIPNALLYDAVFSTDFRHTDPAELFPNFYYLQAAPWFHLRGRTMTNYSTANNTRRAEYGPDTWVEINDAGHRYTVVADGRPVSVDFTSFTPNWRGDAWLAYSREGGMIDYPVPDTWPTAATVKAVALGPDGPGADIPVQVKEGHIRLDTLPETPYRVSCIPPQ